tara:strand:- start:22 stop:1032 length:1011 start_codon:yes stop_codon:yes gene_type:complete
MEYYTNLEEFSASKLLENHGIYGLPHASFYLSLLPKECKDKLMFVANVETRNALKSIYEVQDEFCNSIEEADVYVVPFCGIHDNPGFHIEKWKDEISHAIKLEKKIVYFIGTDNNGIVNIPEKYGLIFRTSGFLSESKSNVYGCPTVNIDIGRPKTYKTDLSISFTGSIETSDGGAYSGSGKYDGIRRDVLNNLLEIAPNKCDFNIKNGWGAQSKEDRIQFFKNMGDNLYSLCVRGGGNYSFRFGESLMMGRIPILIDTDCILPFENEIPYDTNCVRVKPENFDRIFDVIQEYHDAHTEDELIAIQKQNREIWEQYFIPKNTYREINSIINNFNGL